MKRETKLNFYLVNTVVHFYNRTFLFLLTEMFLHCIIKFINNLLYNTCWNCLPLENLCDDKKYRNSPRHAAGLCYLQDIKHSWFQRVSLHILCLCWSQCHTVYPAGFKEQMNNHTFKYRCCHHKDYTLSGHWETSTLQSFPEIRVKSKILRYISLDYSVHCFVFQYKW